MSIGTSEAAPPLSSAEFRIPDAERTADVERKHRRVADFLQQAGLDAIVLHQPSNFAWFTSGANCPHFSPRESRAALFITPEARVVVANNVDSGELFDKELAGLGFQLKERPWQEPRRVLLDDLCRGRKVAGDVPHVSVPDESSRIAAMRLPLEPVECERLRQLGRHVAHAVEATARTMELGQTEAEIAGQLSHRLLKREIFPLRLQVMADGRNGVYRRWTFSDTPLRRWAVISAVASRWGLCCAATRTVCFGNPPDNLTTLYPQVAMLEGTGVFFSQSGSPANTVWEKVRRIYEKLDHADEWRLCDQAHAIGYDVCEMPLTPDSGFVLAEGFPLHWRPSIGPVQMGDTMIVGKNEAELVTPPEQWPTIRIAVRGHNVVLPDLLCREPGK